MNPSSDSPGPSRQPFSPFSSESSSSSSEKRRNEAAAAVEEEDKGTAAAMEEEDKAMAVQPECYVCGRRFGAWKALFGHMRCHPERGWRGVRPVAEGGEEALRGRKRRRQESAAAGEYACRECARVFKTRQALGGHRASHRGVIGCSGKVKETTAAAAVGGGGDGRTVGCQVCGRQFFTYHGMRVHQRVHRERSRGEVEGRKEEKGFIVDLNLPPLPEVAEEEDKQVGNEQG